MKLTKGKISKLYNKKRQSLKKYKKRKSSYKKRTFRNKRKVNLARKTLKRFNYKKHKGGEGETNDTTKDVTTTSIEGKKKQPIIEQFVTETTNQPITELTDKPITELTDEPVIDQPITELTDEHITELTDEPITELTDEPITELTDEPVIDQPITELTDEPITETTTPGEMLNKKKLVKSLSTVVDYIADVVAEKVSQNVSSAQFGEKLQEGFKSVNKAAETMALSGGFKFNKTRRFRITNKTRHNV
jgi:hypothetical protein